MRTLVKMFLEKEISRRYFVKEMMALGFSVTAANSVLHALAETCKPPGTRYNQVQQISSHNSFDEDDLKPGLYEQAEARVRSFELDIHQGAPGGDSPRSDWDVYHSIGDTGDHCGRLSECLAILKRWHDDNPNHEVITIFLQLVDPWQSGGHMPVDLDDNRLAQDLPGLIYRPQELLRRCPGAASLQEAVTRCGWPTLTSLRGRVIIVLNGDIGTVANYGPYGGKLCFIQPQNISFADLRSPQWQNAVFYNCEPSHATDALAVEQARLVSRMYITQSGDDQAAYDIAMNSRVHHIATDHATQQFFEPRLVDVCGKPFRLLPTVERMQLSRGNAFFNQHQA